MGLSIPEPGVGLHLADAGDTECQAPASKNYASGWSICTNTGDTGNLKNCMGRIDVGFGEDPHF